MLQLRMNGSIIAVDDLQERVAELQRNFAKDPPTRSASYGDRLKAAVKRRLADRHNRAGVIASTDDEGFGKKLSDAVKKRLESRGHQGAQQRHHKPVRRPHTSSD